MRKVYLLGSENPVYGLVVFENYHIAKVVSILLFGKTATGNKMTKRFCDEAHSFKDDSGVILRALFQLKHRSQANEAAKTRHGSPISKMRSSTSMTAPQKESTGPLL